MGPKTKSKSKKGTPAETEIQADKHVPDDENRNDVLDDKESELNEMIVQFFEDRPYFYDIAHENWTNKKLKDAELKAFAEKIGWARKYFCIIKFLTKWFIG